MSKDDNSNNNGNSTDEAALAAAIAAAASAKADPVNSLLGVSLPQAVTLVSMLAQAAATAFAPGVTVVGMTVGQLSKLAMGVAEAVPSAVDAFEQIKRAATSGVPPTQDQWDAWNAAADEAHAGLQEAAAAVK